MTRLVVEAMTLRLRRPLRFAWGRLAERQILRVTLVADDGVVGSGEAAPLEPYDGVSLAAVRAALDAYGSVLGAAPADAEREELLRACADERALPQALAAIDLALWDVEARRAGGPVASLLHPHAAETVPVSALVAATDRAGAAGEAAAAVEAGFTTLKVKVGVGDDAARIAAIRAAVGTGVALRIDANGAWGDAQTAAAQLRALAPCGIELVEEPVHGLEEFAALRELSPVPIAMDETATDAAAAGSGAADFACLKVSRSGGITGLLRTAAAARAAGTGVYVGSTLDGPLGVAAGLHAAAALAADAPLPACGLATLPLFAGPEGAAPVRGGAMPVPAGPGLLEPGPSGGW